jgi:hypothetical protein
LLGRWRGLLDAPRAEVCGILVNQLGLGARARGLGVHASNPRAAQLIASVSLLVFKERFGAEFVVRLDLIERQHATRWRLIDGEQWLLFCSRALEVRQKPPVLFLASRIEWPRSLRARELERTPGSVQLSDGEVCAREVLVERPARLVSDGGLPVSDGLCVIALDVRAHALDLEDVRARPGIRAGFLR